MAEIKVKMDKTAIIVAAVVGSLGLLSAILGFAGEGTNATNPSPGLGIAGSILLLAAQIIVSAVGGCCGCCKSRGIPSETKRIVAIICAVGSWILTVVACVLFAEGAAANILGGFEGGMYAGAAVLALVAAALGITSCVILRSQPGGAPNKPGEQPPSGTATGKPQIPPQA